MLQSGPEDILMDLVGIPLAWGVWITLQSTAKSFQ
jgi:hypothetical protein